MPPCAVDPRYCGLPAKVAVYPSSRTLTVVRRLYELHVARPLAPVTALHRRVPSVAVNATVCPGTGEPLLVSVAVRPVTPRGSSERVAVPARSAVGAGLMVPM